MQFCLIFSTDFEILVALVNWGVSKFNKHIWFQCQFGLYVNNVEMYRLLFNLDAIYPFLRYSPTAQVAAHSWAKTYIYKKVCSYSLKQINYPYSWNWDQLDSRELNISSILLKLDLCKQLLLHKCLTTALIPSLRWMLCNLWEFNIFPIPYGSSSHSLTVLTKLIGLIPEEEHSYIIDTVSFIDRAWLARRIQTFSSKKLLCPAQNISPTQESGYHSVFSPDNSSGSTWIAQSLSPSGGSHSNLQLTPRTLCQSFTL